MGASRRLLQEQLPSRSSHRLETELHETAFSILLAASTHNKMPLYVAVEDPSTRIIGDVSSTGEPNEIKMML